MQRNSTASKKKRFLTAYIECGVIVRAAAAAQIDRTNHWRWLHDDPDYAAAFALADEMAISGLEDEARFRATEGLRKYKFDKGQPVYVRCDESHEEAFPAGEDDNGNPRFHRHYFEHDRSDTLLLALLNAAHPDRFGRYRHEHAGKVDVNHSGNVQVYIPDNQRLDPPPRQSLTNGNGHTNGNGTHDL